MNRDVVAALVVAIILGGLLGFGLSYVTLQPTMQTLQKQNTDLSNQVNSLNQSARDTQTASFVVLLSGINEVPQTNSTAWGAAIFSLSRDGANLSYTLIVDNLAQITMAHIHLAPAPGGVGPPVVWLYPSAPPATLIPGISNGAISKGSITSTSLVGSLAGQPLSALLDAMRTGRTYVNVHTNQYPDGEIRGDIKITPI